MTPSCQILSVIILSHALHLATETVFNNQTSMVRQFKTPCTIPPRTTMFIIITSAPDVVLTLMTKRSLQSER